MAKKKNNTNKKNNSIKNKNIIDKKSINDDSFNSEVMRVVIVASVIIVIFCVFYFITWAITGGNKTDKNNDETTVTSISYDNIILGRSFSMGDGEYLVLYYDKSNSDIASTYSSLASSYRAIETALDLYVVNMGDAINKGNVSDEAKYDATNASELAINGPTLIRFSGGAIVEYLEGEEAITNYLS